MPVESVVINGEKIVVNDVLIPWLNRKQQAEEDIKPFLTQIRVNRMFAAGKQHLKLNERDGRIFETRTKNGIELLTSNFLDQYILTVIGRLSGNDFKPNFHVAQDENEAHQEIARMLNQAFSWGWDNEWEGDRKVFDFLRHLAIDGTLAVRARYDRRYGEIIGDVPYKDGTPILDRDEAAKYVAEKAGNGETAQIRTLREGKIIWELVTADNMLPPPGVTDPHEFPWEIIRRPVSVTEIKSRYGSLADDVIEEELESPGSITAGYTDGKATQLTGMAMVYTGYAKPSQEHKEGQTVVFTETALLDVRKKLPLDRHPKGPRSGLHYFRWQVLPGRFMGKAFIENGIGPQKIYNKRHTQINAIIDRNMPKVFIEENSLARPRSGEPMEIIEIRPGSPLPKADAGVQPGAWMMDDIKLQVESVERALGIRGVSMGQAPGGVSAYSAMALLTENDALKLDIIAQEFGAEMEELSWDTMEHMRNWPKDKRMNILGPHGHLESFLFDSSKIPERYLVKRPHGGSLPRSQAAEIQKINDIWGAAAGRLPLAWYVDSLNAGKPLDIPPNVGDTDLHIAELENVIVLQTKQAPPVAPYHDDIRHIESHRTAQARAEHAVAEGNQEMQEVVDAFEQHILEHEASARSTAPSTAPLAVPGQVPAAPSEQPVQPGGASIQPGDLFGALGG